MRLWCQNKIKMSNSKRCFLSCLDGFIEIDLPDGEEVVLGRSVTTQIRDPKCSRKQISCTADFSTNKVHIKILGVQSSGLNNKVLKKGDVAQAVNGDVVEFLNEKYLFVIVFKNGSISEVEPISTSTSSSSPVTKKKRFSKDTSNSSSQSKPEDVDKWESIGDNKLLIFTSKGVSPSNKIASFDMDGTLICTKSGKVFPVDDDDWKILCPQVIPKMEKLIENKFKIVMFTNQAGVEQGKVPVPNLKRKIESVIDTLGVPIQAFISTGKGIYRKPCPGMWQTLVKEKNGGVSIDISKSFYCGDAAGRIDSWAPKKKKDFSCADRLFALNLGIPFFTPEEYFLSEKTGKYELPQFKPTAGLSTALLQSATKIPSDSAEVVVLVGAPGSGKSHFSRTKLLPAGYVHVNRDTLGSWQKCVSMASTALSNGQRVVIDNTNPDLESRKRFIEIAQKASVPCRCMVMSVSELRARHNNKFRELMKEDHAMVSDIIVKMYKSKYKEPQKTEGFSEIIQVNFVPKFENSEAERLYGMYLLDKY